MQSSINPIIAFLTWDNLYSWAVTQPIVGDTNSSFSCPIARYMDEVTEAQWTVDEGKASILHSSGEVEKETYSLPDWADIVANAVDAVERDYITREEFLAIMDEARPEIDE